MIILLYREREREIIKLKTINNNVKNRKKEDY